MSNSPKAQLRLLAVVDNPQRVLRPHGNFLPFHTQLDRHGMAPLQPAPLEILQINVGRLCNQTCGHCHVDAGPDRKEIMTRQTMQWCLDALDQSGAHTVDITGGAPEMNPHFRWLVQEVHKRGKKVIDRCNLTILLVPKYRDLPEFLARHDVEIVASLPHYAAAQTDRQRGEGVFEKSIRALRRLNELGFGRPDSSLRLSLVYNPAGAFLPPRQQETEDRFRKELRRRFGIEFTSLFVITNQPISRFLDYLIRSGNYEAYMQRIVDAFNPAAALGVMCRHTLSVGWDGAIYDCDFNQMLELPVAAPASGHIRDFDAKQLGERTIQTGLHCYACTAGAGSSCQGATTLTTLS